MTDNGAQISYLIEAGMSSDEISKWLNDGISLDELVGYAEKRIANGEPVGDDAEEEPGPVYSEANIGSMLACFKPLADYEEESATWLIPGWIPEGQITVMAADGGTGKTSMWVYLVAALSSGKRCFLDPPGFTRLPKKILFMTTEDSVKKKLRKKLRLAGANMDNIITPDFSGGNGQLLRDLKFGTKIMDAVLRYIMPDLCVFDPVQGFVPPEINMGSRNAMRDCMAPLITIGEDIATTSLVVCHTNKRKGASGRDRIADSADLWDIARSVIMMGITDDPNVRYMSNEKNNYDQLQESILLSINKDGQPEKVGTTWKRDRDYQLARLAPAANSGNGSKKEDTKAWIIEELSLAGGKLPTKDLDEKAKAIGYAAHTYKDAKTELKDTGQIDFVPEGSAKKGTRIWYTVLGNVAPAPMSILPNNTEVPWDGEPL